MLKQKIEDLYHNQSDPLGIENLQLNPTNQLVISEFSIEVVKKMLEYCYDDYLDEDKNTDLVEGLISAASMYQIKELKVGFSTCD